MKVLKKDVSSCRDRTWNFDTCTASVDFIDLRAWCGENFQSVVRDLHILQKSDGEAVATFSAPLALGASCVQIDTSFLLSSHEND